ncbi:Pkinase-domain-containing protein, partial [Rozella allomycis CSF55]
QYAGGGELIDYITTKESLTEKDSRRLYRQIISAIDHCHEAGVVHRDDLKLENLLLTEDNNILISDFGLGRSFIGKNHLLGTFCGTPLYASPEIVSGEKYIGPPSDIWSSGVVLFIMATGKAPFKGDNLSELYKKIRSCEYRKIDNLSPLFVDLLNKIFVRDPSKRIKMEELRNHPWVTKDENGPPIRLPPKFLNEDETPLDKKYSGCIQGINHESDNVVIYNFNQPPGMIQNRRQSITQSLNAIKAMDRRASLLPTDLPGRKQSVFSTISSRSETSDFDVGLEDKKEGIMLASGNNLDARRTSSNEQKDIRFTLAAPEPAMQRNRRFTFQADFGTTPMRQLPNASLTSKIRPKSNSNSDSYQRKSFETRSESNSSRRDSLKVNTNVVYETDIPSPEISPSFPTQVPRQTPIRTVRFAFSANTTSVKPPDDLIDQLIEILAQQNLMFNHHSSYVIDCRYVSGVNQEVVFEIEICKVWLLKIHGIKFRRISGNAMVFKNIIELIIGHLVL